MRTLVYVSGATVAHPDGPWMGVRAALVAADMLFDAGYAPYVPQLTHFWQNEHNHTRTQEDWDTISQSVIPRCDAMLRLTGSSDCDAACADAWHIPVYIDPLILMKELDNEVDGIPDLPAGVPGTAIGDVDPELERLLKEEETFEQTYRDRLRGARAPTKKVYMASGFYGDWKPRAVDFFTEGGWTVLDPEVMPYRIPGDFVGADLAAVREADVVLAVQGDYPFVYGMMAEIGYAVAKEIDVVYVCVSKRVDTFISGLARATFTDIDAAVEFIIERL